MAAFLLTAFVGACGQVSKLPEANEQQAALAARACKLPAWEWTSGIYTLDGEPAYGGNKGIAFSLDITGQSEADAERISERVAQLEACLAAELAKQGVGANIAGSTSQTAQVTDELKHAQTY
ncbi:hypothetical protein [Novosphingobium sp. 28-62-57]|uniref:hypothetical protein n=1 Tax=Novosphingobium sp. 28-62-57 TaxID=1970409 RepID=UPI0025E89E0F|nr:hypothetical protein [Novosphingobium sp. 28-62-57]